MLARRTHRYIAVLVCVVVLSLMWAVVGSGVVLATTKTRYEPVATGTYGPGHHWLWRGTIHGGEKAFATVSGSVTTGTHAWFGWGCGTDGTALTEILSRNWVIAGNSGPGALPVFGADRYCGFDLLVQSGSASVFGTEIRIDYDSADDFSIPSSQPPDLISTPRPDPSGSPVACFASPLPSAALIPSACPTPSPSTPPIGSVYNCADGQGLQAFAPGSRQCLVDYDAGGVYPAGTTVRLQGVARVSASWGGHSKRSEFWVICAPDIATLASQFTALVADSNNTTGALSGASGTMHALWDHTADSTAGDGFGWSFNNFNITVPTGGCQYFAMIDDPWPMDVGWQTNGLSTLFEDSAASATVGPSGSPSAGPSGSPGPSSSPGPTCYTTNPAGVIYTFPCPSAGGSSAGGGIPDHPCGQNESGCGEGGDFPCVPGPMSGLCKPGMGMYGQGGACPFPDGSLNPLDYFGWIGCLIASIPTTIANALQWLINAFVDLIMPSDGLMVAVNGFLDTLNTTFPFSVFGDLIDSISGAGGSVGSLPAIPLPNGDTVPFPTALIADGVGPYRGLMAAGVYLTLTFGLIRWLLAMVGVSRGGGGDEG